MNTSTTIWLSILLGFFSCNALASGQRDIFVTYESIESYPELNLSAKAHTPSKLNYVGTVGNSKHLLMIRQTSYSKRSDGRVGMPWDHISRYYISVENLSIENGWDLTERLDSGGFTVSPSYCPSIRLSAGLTKYLLTDHPKIEKACLD